MSVDYDARVQEFLDTIQATVDASALADKDRITVTADGRDVEKAESRAAGAIVVYTLPTIEWPAPRTTRTVWQFGVVASVDGGLRENAKRLHELLGILTAAGLLMFGDTATPTDFKTSDPNTTMPGYTIRHTEENYS